jgi:hypothetical protein
MTTLLLTGHALAGKTPCAKHLESTVYEMKDWDKYGMRRDNAQVLFPNKCTPLMSAKKMVPLPKRQTGGNVSRMRYMGNDCHIYEWDSESGVFEVYKPNSSKTDYYHQGEITPIQSRELPGSKPNRNHKAGDTGIPGYDMKSLCKDHQAGKLDHARFDKNSKAKNFLKCF